MRLHACTLAERLHAVIAESSYLPVPTCDDVSSGEMCWSSARACAVHRSLS
jgi:hypothetical protein